jgi:hypothetical protein
MLSFNERKLSMQAFKQISIASVLMVMAGPNALAAVMHAGAPVSVPVDSPWALGSLVMLISVVFARAINKRKR